MNTGVAALFERQVVATPDRVACSDDMGAFSYAELSARANRIAHALRERGVSPEMRVGVYMRRSCEFIAALLAVFKAGGVYVPLDPSYPAGFVDDVVDDAQLQCIVSTTALARQLKGRTSLVLCVDSEDVAQRPELDIAVRAHAWQLAYISYTSGSTGRPKGVMVPHGQILNWLHALWEMLPFGEAEVVVQKTSQAFVVATKEILSALLAGVPQVIVADEVVKDTRAFLGVLQQARATRLNIVPSHLNALLEQLHEQPQALQALRCCITAGEGLSQALYQRVVRQLPHVQLWNNFGCTELHDTSYSGPEHLGGEGMFVPIGRPIANVALHVLDDQLRPLPLGVAGELCVDNPWMARGYWRQPGLTAERFVPNPFSDEPGRRLYRTGDLVRRLANGSLEYLGREDFEIKVRGHRIDVRQVEAALAACPGVRHGLVGAWRDERGLNQLVAYVVAFDGQEPPAGSQLQPLLAQHLPGYMVPSLYVQLDALPLTPNGKLDRKALPAPDASALAQQPYVEPATDTERALAAIWSELLAVPVEKIGRHDNFFALGGHSLIATQLATRIQCMTQTSLPLINLFKHPTLSVMAKTIDALKWVHERAQTSGEHASGDVLLI
jgi:amino acid adenylation domain-containing protein